MGFSSVIGASSVIRPGVCTSTTRPSSPYDGQVIYETDTDKMFVYNGPAAGWTQIGASGDISVTSVTASGNISSNGAFRSGTSNIIQFVDVGPLYQEWSWTGAQNGSQTLSTSIPTNARYLLANVFVTASSSDHQNIELSSTSCATNIKNWVDTRGSRPGGEFGSMTARNSVYLTYHGEVDGYSPNYGVWFNSLTVPVTGRTLFWSNWGNSGSNGWIALKIYGYSI